MTEVAIPFRPQFRDALLEGRKTLTSRTSRMAEPGDTFRIFDAVFEVLAVDHLPLRDVANRYREEGLASRDEFLDVWLQIHTRRQFGPSDKIWAHSFRRLS